MKTESEIALTDYTDYGYYNNNSSHISSYILSPVMKHLQDEKDKTILDIGCGNGWLVNKLLAEGFDVYGIDASQSGIKIANEINPGRFFVQNINSSRLPNALIGKKFELILSTEVIEHLYNPVDYIAFCKSVLLDNGGGKIILTTPYHGYLKNILLAITGRMDYHYSPLWVGGHIKFWSKETITQLLIEQGFRIEAFEGCGRLPYLWKSMLIKASL